MSGYGFLMDLRTCIGCHSCQFACAEQRSLANGEWLRRVFHLEAEDHKRYVGAFSMGCNHCEDPACVKACQNGAISRDEEKGVVLNDSRKCIGCGACTWACPYGAVSISEETGKAHKCDSCIERRQEGFPPACVAACPVGSLRFGSIREFDEEGAEQLEMEFLPDVDVTRPSTRIIVRRAK